MPKEEKKSMRILSENIFPVVGVGASAGGLDAFKELVKAIPEDSGMAYILTQHLAPQYESLLAEILQKVTKIPVLEITDNIKVLPDHVYIIPSNSLLTANDGTLQLDPLVKGDKLNVIDVFFTSLAEVHQDHTIGVVLSGTGSDGTVGLKTIKDLGGITIVQDEQTAAYYAMPQSAIAAEVVDFVLPPNQIPKHLIELIRSSKILPPNFSVSEEIKEEQTFKQILALIRNKKGVDFSYYKQTTIRRRILRRKALNKIETLKKYHHFLLENKEEQDALFKDILIPVTAFFRDPKTFTDLCEKVFPVLFKEKTGTEPIRIWIAGCSTGEEAYSMAICLYEYLSNKASKANIQIFATDINEALIAKARSGVYQKKDMAGVSEARIKNYFTKVDGSYLISKAIREMCIFACQNFLKDPPFARIDLISCRNVLIYMEPYLQKKALTTFHYALNTKGFLLLGKSESPGQSSEFFNTFSQQDKLYTKKDVAGKYMHVATEGNEAAFKRKDDYLKTSEVRKDDFQKAADHALLSRYEKAGVIVNEHLDILQFRGSTGQYLEAPPGKASHNILKMAREGLSFELRNALHKARNGEIARKEGIPLDKGKRKVTIEVLPLKNTIEPYFLVLFEESAEKPLLPSEGAKKKPGKKEDAQIAHHLDRIKELEQELAQVREDMHAITEDQEAANEELQSANEELLSGSEELQSLNEELETTKEEIQSTNEELTILNQELLERNEQLVHSRKYAEAIVTTIHEPLIILTKELRIKNANRSFYEKFQVTEQQTEGKPFFEWNAGMWEVAGLREELQKILPDHSFVHNYEVVINSNFMGQRCFVLNARQLINENSEEQLILLAIEDITERKALENSQKLFAQELEQKVLERTIELKQANIKLQQSNENLQQFASIASHDLQEPLRKIKTFTSLLTTDFSKELPDGGKTVIKKIKTSAERMSQLIKEVLHYSKLNHTKEEFTATNLDVILKNVLNDLELLQTETKAVINYKEPLPVIDAIPLQMNQLFNNLLTNALKFYDDARPPVITISYRTPSGDEIKKVPELREGSPYIEINFSDNGIGFEQQFAGQIFQIFERLHPVEEYEGTGIGLAICKKIVENHHGHIYALSKENEGASFYVFLPVKQ